MIDYMPDDALKKCLYIIYRVEDVFCVRCKLPDKSIYPLQGYMIISVPIVFILGSIYTRC